MAIPDVSPPTANGVTLNGATPNGTKANDAKDIKHNGTTPLKSTKPTNPDQAQTPKKRTFKTTADLLATLKSTNLDRPRTISKIAPRAPPRRTGPSKSEQLFYFGMPLLVPSIILLLQILFYSPLPKIFLASLGRCALAIFVIQLAAAVPSVVTQNEVLYDLAGAVSFLSVVGLSLGFPAPAAECLPGGAGFVYRGVMGYGWTAPDGAVWRTVEREWTQVVGSVVVVVWAVRLGAYTFIRAVLNGGDSRFDSVRDNPKRFFVVFMAQGIWVLICCLPVITLNTVPADVLLNAGPHPGYVAKIFLFGLGMFSFLRGFAIECLADWQLTKWRWDKWRGKHNEVFCGRGLWAQCRHPNYYGESLIWLGIAMCCYGTLLGSPARQALSLGGLTMLVLCFTTPWFVYKMLRNISIPIIELKYDRIYENCPEYALWRRGSTFRIWL